MSMKPTTGGSMEVPPGAKDAPTGVMAAHSLNKFNLGPVTVPLSIQQTGVALGGLE